MWGASSWERGTCPSESALIKAISALKLVFWKAENLSGVSTPRGTVDGAVGDFVPVPSGALCRTSDSEPGGRKEELLEAGR